MKSVIKSSIKSTYSFGSGGELHHLNAHGILAQEYYKNKAAAIKIFSPTQKCLEESKHY